jgi:UDPglucose 6-dehydrogenase
MTKGWVLAPGLLRYGPLVRGPQSAAAPTEETPTKFRIGRVNPLDRGSATLPVADRPMDLGVVGAGYVGLVTAACLASLGHRVRVIDIDRDRIAGLSGGSVPITEPDLALLVRRGLSSGLLSFHDEIEAADGVEMAFVTVGTLDGAGHWTDANVVAVLRQLLERPVVAPTVVVRSTLAPGTMLRLQRLVVGAGAATHLVFNPEFTREGAAIGDFLSPDRIVIGIAPGLGDHVAEPLRRLYAPLSSPFLVVDHASAEMIKIGSNAFLAAKITFANELARLCAANGVDMSNVRHGIGLDARIGPAFLASGPGYGGSCLPSQVELLAAMSDELDLDLELIPAVHRFNRQAPRRLVRDLLADIPIPERVVVLGVAFKAGTDDVRESPALRLIDALRERGVSEIRACDPAVRRLPSHPSVELSADPYESARGAELAIIATEWPEFRTLDWFRMAAVMKGREVFDARSVIEFERAAEAGFRVRSLERRARPRSAVESSAARRVPSRSLVAVDVRA